MFVIILEVILWKILALHVDWKIPGGTHVQPPIKQKNLIFDYVDVQLTQLFDL